MPEAKGRRTAASDFVSKIVKDPKQPPNTLLLKGYLGDSSEEGYTRLYLDPQLSDYVEIPADAILHTQEVADDPLGGSCVWIQRDAEVLHGKVGPDRLKARFLEGRIYQQYMRGAQFGGGGAFLPPPSFPQICPPTPQCPPQSSPIAVCPTEVCGGYVSAYCPSPYQPLCPPTIPPLCLPPTRVLPQCQPSVFFPQCQPPTQPQNCQLITESPVQCQSQFQPQCIPQTAVIQQCQPSLFFPQCQPPTLSPQCQLATALSPQCQPATLRGCPSAVDACPSVWGCGFPGGNLGGWGR